MNDEKDVGNDKRFNVELLSHRTGESRRRRLKQRAISTVPFGTCPLHTLGPNAEALGFSQASLRDETV